MTIVTMKKKLLAGHFPNDDGKSIRLKDKQIKYLVATVPCVKIHNKNACQYYFPEAKTFLKVVFYGGFGRCTTEGTLLKVPHDYSELFYEDNIRKYVPNEKGLPMVFKYNSMDSALQQRICTIQTGLWLAKKPYHVRIEGYKSKHTKGWPKDNYGGEKVSLHINDGDYETVYLTLEPINASLNIFVYGKLKEAILYGEYKGAVHPSDFERNITEKGQAERRAFDYRYEFKRFVKDGPVEKINQTIEKHNEDLKMYKDFLKMATQLHRIMRENPGCFRKVKKVKKNSKIKSSVLFKEMNTLRGTIDRRRAILNDENNYQTPNIHWAIEKAVHA